MYPYTRLSEIKDQYSVTVCDFGYFREDYAKDFGECDIKIMLCSAADWDIPLLETYLKFPKPYHASYLHDTYYCFTRVAPKKFGKHQRQLMKGGFVAYRLHNSPDWTAPHKANADTYAKMLAPFRSIPDPEKPKPKLIKLK